MIPCVVTSVGKRTVNVVTVSPTPVELVDIPVWTIFTGDSMLDIPLAKGTSGVLIYFSVESRRFLEAGEVLVDFNRPDPERNCFFLPGFNSGIQDIDLKGDRLRIKYKGLTLEMRDGKLSITNNQADLIAELAAVVGEIIGCLTEPDKAPFSYTEMGVTIPVIPNTIYMNPAKIAELQLMVSKIGSFT